MRLMEIDRNSAAKGVKKGTVRRLVRPNITVRASHIIPVVMEADWMCLVIPFDSTWTLEPSIEVTMQEKKAFRPSL